MAKNKITDLRDHLFETLEALKDPEKPMDLARAKAICEVSQTIINTAKVEVDIVAEMRRAADAAQAEKDWEQERHDEDEAEGEGA